MFFFWTELYNPKKYIKFERGMIRIAIETACAAARQNTRFFGDRSPYIHTNVYLSAIDTSW